MKSVLTSKDIEDFWIRVYLGASKDFVGACIDRAYRDFNRTQHGYGKLKTADSFEQLKVAVRKIISDSINRDFTNQNEYDKWHESNCDYLINLCINVTTYKMYYGQAQKWINMSLKYLAALGDSRVPGVSKNYVYFHFPIDNIIQDMLKAKGLPPLKISWSRIDAYKVYLDYQKQFRLLHPNKVVLDVEFKLFNQLT